MRRATGIANGGKPVTMLAPGIRGIRKVVIGSRELQHLRRWDMGDPAVVGCPTMFSVYGGKIHFWPTPDRAYSIDVSWDGGDDDDGPQLPVDDNWLIEYYEELQLARESV